MGLDAAEVRDLINRWRVRANRVEAHAAYVRLKHGWLRSEGDRLQGNAETLKSCAAELEEWLREQEQ